ncbi:MAG: hypothetical protein AAGA03_18560, partial [Planctomycetota bacterium]
MTSAWASRRSGVLIPFDWIAGITYALGGSVLFLYCNPPFLAGAAWLPLVIGSLFAGPDRSKSERPQRRRIGRWRLTGVAMAMMVLAGDPQTALHTAMVGIAFAIAGSVRLLASRRRPSQPAKTRGLIDSVWATAGFVAACLLAGLLSLPQIAASADWSRMSDRRVSNAPDSDSWWKAAPLGSRRQESFQFSVPPWQLTDAMVPSSWGTMFPTCRRLSLLFAPNHRIWTPSLYAGVLIGIALLAQLGEGFRGRMNRWHALLLITFLISMGRFGFLWFIGLFGVVPQDYDPSVGGPYWLLYKLMPGYDAFRYPAKWLPFTALAASVLASRWAQRSASKQPRAAARLTAIVLILLLLVSLGVTALRTSQWISSPTGVGDRFWGPLHIDGAWYTIQMSLVHAMLFTGGILSLLIWRSKRNQNGQPYRLSRSGFAIGLITITLIDVAVAASPLIATVDKASESELLDRTNQPTLRGRWMRTETGGGWPPEWARTRNPNRILEVEVSQRASWFGRWHLAEGQSVFNSMPSIQSEAMRAFWNSSRRQLADQAELKDQIHGWRRLCEWVAIDGERRAAGQRSDPFDHPIHIAAVTTQSASTAAGPIDFVQSGSLVAADRPDWQSLIDSVCESSSHRPFIEPVDATGGVWRPGSGARAPATATIQVDSPDELEVALRSSESGLWVRPVLQDGHWTAQTRRSNALPWVATPVYRVDKLKQGVLLESGEHQVRWRYSP